MIGVVCLNPALDITHHVAAVDWSGVNRPDVVAARPGGKGLNVARTLHALGAEVLVMGLAGGATGEAVTTGLADLAVPADFTGVAGETRRTFTVVDGRTGHAAAFNEPGPVIAADEYAEFRDRYASALAGCAVMVLSGSLPPGLAPGSYAELTAMAAAAGVPVLLDAHGDALRLGAAAGPAVVKPNLAELEMFAGRPLSGAPGRGGGRRGAPGRRPGGGRGIAGPRRAVRRHARGPLAGRPPDRGGRERDRGRRRRSRGPGLRAGPAAAVGRAAAARGRARHRGCPGPGGRGIQSGGLRHAAGRVRGDAHDSRPARGGRLMAAAGMSEIVGTARAAGRGVGAFNVIGLEHAEAIVAGAQAAASPVVLQISENCVAYHGALEPIARACLSIADSADVPVAVHLDHAIGEDLVHAAARLGLRSVMYDASALPYEQNVQVTADMARWCQDRGIWVEAELGEIGGKDGVHSPGARTQPDEAAAYVAATGVDALAVAVGSSHAMLTRDAALDLELIEKIRDAVSLPLVLHGSSGVPDAGLAAAVRAGMTKINVATQLNKAFTAAVRASLDGDPEMVDPRRYGSAGRDAVAAEVARLLHVIGGAGDPVSAVE